MSDVKVVKLPNFIKRFLKHLTDSNIPEPVYSLKRIKSSTFIEFADPIITAMFKAFIAGGKSNQEKKNSHYIIGKFDENNSIKFSDTPHIHSTLHNAKCELKRLVELFPDTKFLIYESVLMSRPVVRDTCENCELFEKASELEIKCTDNCVKWIHNLPECPKVNTNV